MASDTKVNEVWITYDPDDGYEEYATEAEGRAALEALVEYHRERAADDAMHESVNLVCLYRCECVARVKQTITASREDNTEQGEWCRERGFDYLIELGIEEVPDVE